jgi:hypothetical protein
MGKTAVREFFHHCENYRKSGSDVVSPESSNI